MRSESELKALAENKGWKARPLTVQEIHRMPSEEYEFHEKFNGAAIERAFEEPAARERNKKLAKSIDAKRIWDDKATHEETQAGIDQVKIFTSRFPQFIGSYTPNREAILSWLRDRNAAVTFETLRQSFEALAIAGKLLLCPRALGARLLDAKRVRDLTAEIMRMTVKPSGRMFGGGTRAEESQCREQAISSLLSEIPDEISGAALVNFPKLEVLLQPVSYRSPLEVQSADEFKQAHPEAFRQEQPSQYELKSVDQAISTFKSLHPEYQIDGTNRERIEEYFKQKELPITLGNLEAAYQSLVAAGEIQLRENAVVQSGSVKIIDLGGNRKQQGYPDYTAFDKVSWRRRIERMSSAEYAEAIRSEKGFAEAAEKAYE